MAEYFGLGADEPLEQSERIVADSLRRLPEPWVIFHHVTWQRRRRGRQADGEADFILVHPKHGCLVIEVKGGGIHIDKGRWCTTDRFGQVHTIKNPFEQATASKHALIDSLSDFPFASRMRVGHAVAFPHHLELPQLGIYSVPAITLHIQKLQNVESSIMECVGHWGLNASLSPADMHQLIDTLAPTVNIERLLSVASKDADTRILTLTAEQVLAFAGLRASRGGLILGSAGTGKTVLAVARAQQLARDGFRTLLVCFNELLGDELARSLKDFPGLEATTFHGLCLREARRAGLKPPNDFTPKWWEESAPELLLRSCENTGKRFDAVVVDEGQDFSPVWLDALQMILDDRKDAPFYVFADPRQDLWGRDWREASEFPFIWELTRNLRNTEPIARQVARTVGASCISTGVMGPDPLWTDSCLKAVSEADVLDAIDHLVQKGFEAHSLVVMTMGTLLCNRLRERTVGSLSLGRWGGRGIAVETIYRFKGLESEAVVLALDSADQEKFRTLAYVGMSRARTVLSVVGPMHLKKLLSWVEPDPG